MSAGEWIALVGLMLALVGAGFAAWNTLRNEIRDSRHMVMNKLQAIIEGLETDIEKLSDRVGVVEREIAVLKAGRGAD